MKILKISVLVLGVIVAIIITCYSVSRIKTVTSPLSVYSNILNSKNKVSHDTRRLKVAAYNIAHGRGGKYGAKNWSHGTKDALLDHLDKISEQIKKENADLIVLNEVDFSSAWSFNINQAEYIAQKCGYSYRLEQKNMGVSVPFFSLYFGNAILSKFPIQNPKFIDFQPYSGLEDIFAGNHDAFFCELKVPTGIVGIFGIHFEYRSETVRVRCAKILAEMSSELKTPVIILGDFNSTPSNMAHSKVSENGKNAMSLLFDEKKFISYLENSENKKPFYTFPSEKPNSLIDWIIGKRIKAFTNPRNIKSNLSDHLMIVAEVEF